MHFTDLKQQERKCRVPHALAHSDPQLSQLRATGFVDPNSQTAIPKLNHSNNRQKLRFLILLTKHKHKCERN